ncbi:hypothetical protein V9T40_012175 [Parthenolecanium corni]|uniref:Uncharacterized protein n=1 Tax=Parthenolecanium corni TaxID=536013 RepID=A0AAN9T868_9HEMI
MHRTRWVSGGPNFAPMATVVSSSYSSVPLEGSHHRNRLRHRYSPVFCICHLGIDDLNHAGHPRGYRQSSVTRIHTPLHCTQQMPRIQPKLSSGRMRLQNWLVVIFTWLEPHHMGANFSQATVHHAIRTHSESTATRRRRRNRQKTPHLAEESGARSLTERRKEPRAAARGALGAKNHPKFTTYVGREDDTKRRPHRSPPCEKETPQFLAPYVGTESIHQYYKTKLESQATRPTSFPQTENENKDSLGSANVYNLLNFTAETAGKQSRKKLHQFDYSKLSGCQYFAKT